MAEALTSVATKQLRVGAQLRSAIYDNREVLLLAHGMVITPRFKSRLLARGIDNVMIPESEVARLCSGAPQGTAKTAAPEKPVESRDFRAVETAELDREVLAAELGMPVQEPSLMQDVTQHGTAAFDRAAFDNCVESRERNIESVTGVFESMLRGGTTDLATLQEIADSTIEEFIQDCDLFASIGINPHSGEYPARHSMHVAMLALSIGARLGLDRITLRDLCLGCLLHDAGMLMIDQSVYQRDEILDPIQFLEISKHPVFIFEQLSRQEGIPRRPAYIAYQIHERCDGSGYPRGRTSAQIHFLSKVAAVADCYAGLVAPRSYRPAMAPYHALEMILRRTGEGKFDPHASRALLETISLFPIGSYVQLSDGRVGQVMRSTTDYANPIVDAWDAEGAKPEEMIDLSQQPSITVSGVLDSVPPKPSPPDLGIDDF